MLSVKDFAEQDTSLKKESSREYSGPCPSPECSKKRDGFRVRCDDHGRWAFMCRGCWDAGETLPNRDKKRGWGDEVAYLIHYRHANLDDAIMQVMDSGLLSFEDAYKRYAYEKRWPYERAQQHLLDLGANKDQQRVRRPVQKLKQWSDFKSQAWQEHAHKAVEEYAACLWSPEGAQGLEYALARGLHYKTIQTAKLGFSMQGGTPRLIIPLLNFHFHEYEKGWYFTIFRRDLRPDCSHEERWKNAKGSSTEELYLADCLKAKRVTVLTEAPLDALSIAQECGDLVNAVATSGVSCGQNLVNLARLALMPLVLVAFDADQAGDKEAKWWLDRLPNARRLRPFLHDVNDMLVDNWDVRVWVEREMDPHKPVVEQEQDSQEQELAQDIGQWNVSPSSKKSSLPSWLIPGTREWDKQVARNGIDEMNARRQAALMEQAS